MEGPVPVAVLGRLHRLRPGLLLKSALDTLEVGGVAVQGGKLGRARLDQSAGLHHLDGADVAFADFSVGADTVRAWRRLQNLNAAPDPDRDLPAHLQGNKSFADRRPAHAQLFGEIALGRQERPYRKQAFADAVADQCGNLPVESHGLDLRKAKPATCCGLLGLRLQGLVHRPPRWGSARSPSPKSPAIPA